VKVVEYEAIDWEVEPGDPSVGIFGPTVAHVGCSQSYDAGVEILFPTDKPVERWLCHDCGDAVEWAEVEPDFD
jgi:hypothetical protein